MRCDIRSSSASISVTGDKARARARSALRSSKDSQADEERSVSSAHSLAQSLAGSVRSSSAARTRPSTPKAENVPVKRKAVRQVAMPIVSYRGTQTKCDIAGLEPNRL